MGHDPKRWGTTGLRTIDQLETVFPSDYPKKTTVGVMGGLQSGSCGSRPQKIGNHRSEGNQGHQPRNVLFFSRVHTSAAKKSAETLEGKVFVFWFVSLFLVCLLFSAPFYLSGFGAGRGRQNPLWAPSTGVESLRRRREKKRRRKRRRRFVGKKKTKKKQKNNKKTMTATASAELS